MTTLINRLRDRSELFLFRGGDELALLLAAMLERVETLERRLEIDPRHSWDGIACRDETIRGLDRERDRLTKVLRNVVAQLEPADEYGGRQAYFNRREVTAMLAAVGEVEAP